MTGVGTPPEGVRDAETDAQEPAEPDSGGSTVPSWAETNKNVRKLRKR